MKLTKEQLDVFRRLINLCTGMGEHISPPSTVEINLDYVQSILAHIDEQQAEIDKLRQHALALAKALDNIEVMVEDEETEIRWTAKNALDVYFAVFPKEARR